MGGESQRAALLSMKAPDGAFNASPTPVIIISSGGTANYFAGLPTPRSSAALTVAQAVTNPVTAAGTAAENAISHAEERRLGALEVYSDRQSPLVAPRSLGSHL